MNKTRLLAIVLIAACILAGCNGAREPQVRVVDKVPPTQAAVISPQTPSPSPAPLALKQSDPARATIEPGTHMEGIYFQDGFRAGYNWSNPYERHLDRPLELSPDAFLSRFEEGKQYPIDLGIELYLEIEKQTDCTLFGDLAKYLEFSKETQSLLMMKLDTQELPVAGSMTQVAAISLRSMRDFGEDIVETQEDLTSLFLFVNQGGKWTLNQHLFLEYWYRADSEYVLGISKSCNALWVVYSPPPGTGTGTYGRTCKVINLLTGRLDMEYHVYDYDTNGQRGGMEITASHLSGISFEESPDGSQYYVLDDLLTLTTGRAYCPYMVDAGEYVLPSSYQFQRERKFTIVQINGKGQMVMVSEELYIPAAEQDNVAVLNFEHIQNQGAGQRFGPLQISMPLQ